MIIKTNDIFIVYVSFVDKEGGKRRPVLIIDNDEKSITFFKITTKFKNKSSRIKNNYYPLAEWFKSGLASMSYVDTGKAARVSRNSIGKIYKIGELNFKDIIGLNKFMKNK